MPLSPQELRRASNSEHEMVPRSDSFSTVGAVTVSEQHAQCGTPVVLEQSTELPEDLPSIEAVMPSSSKAPLTDPVAIYRGSQTVAAFKTDEWPGKRRVMS